MKKAVWVVTYTPKVGDEPVVTVWDNEAAAAKHYKYELFRGNTSVTKDKCPVYCEFRAPNE